MILLLFKKRITGHCLENTPLGVKDIAIITSLTIVLSCHSPLHRHLEPSGMLPAQGLLAFLFALP